MQVALGHKPLVLSLDRVHVLVQLKMVAKFLVCLVVLGVSVQEKGFDNVPHLVNSMKILLEHVSGDGVVL